MQTIWKVPITLTDRQEIEVPQDAQFLTVEIQRSIICLWFRCDPSRSTEKRTILVVGTGHEAPDRNEGPYLGTVMESSGQFVWHIFESLVGKGG